NIKPTLSDPISQTIQSPSSHNNGEQIDQSINFSSNENHQPGNPPKNNVFVSNNNYEPLNRSTEEEPISFPQSENCQPTSHLESSVFVTEKDHEGIFQEKMKRVENYPDCKEKTLTH